MTSPFRIQALTDKDIDLFIEHITRHLAESGQPGTPIFAPIDETFFKNNDERRDATLARWRKPLTDTGWERAWGVFTGDKIVGHLDLQCGHLPVARHRVFLGMGLESHMRGQGLGRELLTLALNWTAMQPDIEWMELRVFANNEPAIALYKALGFHEDGRVNDMFRIKGAIIDDIFMSRKVR